MCKNHDQLHFPVLCREVASLLAGDQPSDRDMFLQVALYAGFDSIVSTHSGCIPVGTLTKVRSRLEAERTRLFTIAQGTFDRVHDRWEAEVKATDDPPF